MTSMSQTNLLIAKRFFEDRTQTDVERFLSFLDPGAEMDFSELDRPYGRVYRGPEEIRTLFHEITAPWQEVNFVTSDPVAGGDWVVIDVQRTAYSPGGLTVFSSTTVGMRVCAGKIVCFKVFQQRDDALRAAGLSD